MNKEILLRVEDLTISFYTGNKLSPVVNQLSFTLNQGEILGIVGESGSGKTMTALAIMDLLPESAVLTSGSVYYSGNARKANTAINNSSQLQKSVDTGEETNSGLSLKSGAITCSDLDLMKASKEELRELKGTELAMIFQEPMTSLNPLLTIGYQVEEMLRLHTKLSAKVYKEMTIAALLEAGLDEAETIYYKYPHELSGGMRQRAMIAMSMIAGPKLLIADEPTTALDVTIQDKILKQLKIINQTHNTSIILVSHDLGVVKSVCNRVLVMKDGRVVEEGNAQEIFLSPSTDYTKKLVAAAPVTWMKHRGLSDQSMEGELNNNGNKSADYNITDEITQQSEIVLMVDGLNVYYSERAKQLFGRKHRKQVVKNASLHIHKGEALGIVGESGCGKTTLAKAIAGLIKDREGLIKLSELSESRRDVVLSTPRPQMVFQDPYGSLNPVKKVGWILEEPLRIHGSFKWKERKKRVEEVIQQVGLEVEHLGRYVSQLSGGQRQRVAIAAALILNPKLIILDEPVSSLDVTVQAQILDLLKELQQRYQLSYLFISHDLNVIYQVCDRVSVMYEGELVETSKTRDLFHNPVHSYSRELLEASLPD